MKLDRLWLIGCGNMGGAMLRRWIDAGVVAADRVDVVNRSDRALPAGVRQARTVPEGPLPDMVMLGMKPQQLDEIAGRYGAQLAGVPVLASILAGVEIAALARRFRCGTVVRAMPNLPVAIGKGVVGLHAEGGDADTRAAIDTIMAPLGLVEWVADEKLFDSVTALAGSGPGFLYRFVDALAEAGAALGLPADQAQRMAIATVEGSALLAAGADVSPAVLADRVASPGGSTREGLNVLDREDALKILLRETLAASTRRNAEMAAAAR
ncbi:pyrroline-5-carboxylate reductase [Sphingomonas sp. ZT3P38]|uniref:pyrroline-5-carboxylate reductase n=1 Tax=Parasphingomonas zepuensis TaxID=3096161 RepID=UPI002FC79586